ncbi:hypothetical protein [Synechococcus sp. CS-1328]|uniref:hypothetical protein n=1 Tax=Synechococcus sp. CS-1328 TaxID=2847976 RepID=UPI00223BFDBC|nr:hypothetical protein [Synechococcus sp. CS-1328]
MLLTGCQGIELPFSIPGFGGGPAAQAPAPDGKPPAREKPASEPPIDSSGLTPLPKPQEVVASMAVGRLDPFSSPLLSASGKLPSGLPGAPGTQVQVRPPLSLPEAFRFNGVVASSGRPQALVQFGAVSGSLAQGDQGGRSTDLLPPGWSVQAVDVQQGRLVLRQADRTITAEL